jgi:hypothetical protein
MLRPRGRGDTAHCDYTTVFYGEKLGKLEDVAFTYHTTIWKQCFIKAKFFFWGGTVMLIKPTHKVLILADNMVITKHLCTNGRF